MKRSVWLALALCLFLLGTARAQVSTYTALLTGANETPNPADPDGVGFAVFTLDPGAGTISFTAYAQNIAAPTASHIHRGAAGVTGPVVIPFNKPFNSGVSSDTLTGIAAGLMTDIIANPPGYYFNIHNADFPGGAIRGELRPAPGTSAPNVVYIPVTVKATGARGENFVEDVRIVSRASAAASVTVDFFASNAAGLASPTATETVTVAAGQQLVLNDILGSTFGTSGIGALRFTTDKDVIVEARILDDKRSTNQGQLGFFIHGLAVEAPCRFGTLPVLPVCAAGGPSLPPFHRMRRTRTGSRSASLPTPNFGSWFREPPRYSRIPERNSRHSTAEDGDGLRSVGGVVPLEALQLIAGQRGVVDPAFPRQPLEASGQEPSPPERKMKERLLGFSDRGRDLAIDLVQGEGLRTADLEDLPNGLRLVERFGKDPRHVVNGDRHEPRGPGADDRNEERDSRE